MLQICSKNPYRQKDRITAEWPEQLALKMSFDQYPSENRNTTLKPLRKNSSDLGRLAINEIKKKLFFFRNNVDTIAKYII